MKTFSICFGNGNQYGNKRPEKDKDLIFEEVVTLTKPADVNKSLSTRVSFQL